MRIKLNLKEKIVYYKAYWVLKGNSQKYGIDYDKTYALVIMTIYFKIIFEKVTKEDFEIEQQNKIKVFLNSPISNWLLFYVEQPIGYKTIKDLICLLL